MITLRLPAPPSVNRTRKVNWANRRIVSEWTQACDAYVISERQVRKKVRSPYWVHIVFGEKCRLDLDNGIKGAIDYLVRIEVVEDDGPKHLRRLVVERGDAPEGMVVTVGEMNETQMDA